MVYDYEKQRDFAGKDTMNTEQNSVPIGVTSVAGWTTALAAFAGAVVAYLTGNHSVQTVTAIELAGIGLISGGITQLGRYFQAHKNIVGTNVTEVIHQELTPGNANSVSENAPESIEKSFESPEVANELGKQGPPETPAQVS